VAHQRRPRSEYHRPTFRGYLLRYYAYHRPALHVGIWSSRGLSGTYLEHETLVYVCVTASELYVWMGAKLRFNGCVVQERFNPAHFTVTQIAVFSLVTFLANIVWVQSELLVVAQQNAKLRMLFEQAL
jgi:hypothetical protein